VAKENISNERLYRALEKKAESACATAKEVQAHALGRELLNTIEDDKALGLRNKSIEALQEMRRVFSAWDPNPPQASDDIESYKKREQLLVDCDDYKTALLSAVDNYIALKQSNRQEAAKQLEKLKQTVQNLTYNIDYDQLTDNSKRKLNKIETIANDNKLYPEQKLEKLHKLVGDNPKQTLKLDVKTENIGTKDVKTENIGTKLERALKSLGSALQSCVDTLKSFFSRSRQENLHDFRDIMHDDYASYDAKADDEYDNRDGPSRSGPSGPGR
jgi:hypothetical protein